MDTDSNLGADLTAEEQELLADIRKRKIELLKEIQEIKNEIQSVTLQLDHLEPVPVDAKATTRSKSIAVGRRRFNVDCNKGIEYMIANNLIEDTPESKSEYLFNADGLNKTMIGEYLGELGNVPVLHKFVERHNFTDLLLVDALRQFLWTFRLPGEAQKIDRMMETFALRYCECNPGMFSNTDTCFVLSFAIIMLNTSLHNPNVKDKPSVERFILMNRGINDGSDLPEELLRNLYANIRAEPFAIPDDDGSDLTHTFFNPDKEGYLWKQGGRYKSWRRRWFILTENCLYYFENIQDKEPKGIIPLENVSIKEVEDSKKPNCFEIYSVSGQSDGYIKACKADSDGKMVEGKHTAYRMSAQYSSEKEEWMKSIRASISRDPFYEILSNRKKNATQQKI